MRSKKTPAPPAAENKAPPKRCTRADAARRLGVSPSAIARWEAALPRDVAVQAGVERLVPFVDDEGVHWHEVAAIQRLNAALARAQVKLRGRRKGPGELHATIFERLTAGRSVPDIVVELRLPMPEVLRLARVYREGTPDGVLVPRQLAMQLNAALGTAQANPSQWVAAADVLRALVRRRAAELPKEAVNA